MIAYKIVLNFFFDFKKKKKEEKEKKKSVGSLNCYNTHITNNGTMVSIITL